MRERLINDGSVPSRSSHTRDPAGAVNVRIDEVPLYGTDIDFYFSARPGLTGVWQVSGRSDAAYSKRVALDRRYVENWSLWTDLVVVLKTVPVVLTARSAY